MVVHYFQLRMTHLAPYMIDSFLKNIDKDIQEIVLFHNGDLLFGDFDVELQKFKDVFNKHSYINYKVVIGEKDLFRHLYHALLLNKRCVLNGYFHMKYSLRNMFFFLRNKSLFSNIILVHWGIRRYGNQGVKKKGKAFLQCILYRSYGTHITLTAEDRKILLDNFSGLSKIVVLSYIPSKKWHIPLNRKSNNKLKVIISQSGFPHNNHIEALDVLHHRFENYIDEVNMPLCYGIKEYMSEIIKKGKELFGERFTYFNELLPREKFSEHISNYDIYITAANIQTGLGAATYALMNGLKVYCGDNIKEYFEDKGCLLFTFKDLYTESEEEFKTPLLEEQVKLNNDCLNDENEYKNRVLKWKQVLGLNP